MKTAEGIKAKANEKAAIAQGEKDECEAENEANFGHRVSLAGAGRRAAVNRRSSPRGIGELAALCFGRGPVG